MVRFALKCLAVGLSLGLSPLIAASPSWAEVDVDLALVLAVDISYSMDTDEQALQREGFAEAFRSPLVHEAIRDGLTGRIAVTYVEWAGTNDQQVIVPWTILDNPEGLLAFSEKIASTPLRRAQRTSISSAIDFSVKLFALSGVNAARQVIDISGDGPNNQGRAVTDARDEANAKGIIINGLPLMMRQPGYLDIPNLDAYYKDCVIGGPGSFMIPVKEREQFPQAIKTKILLEVANITPPQPVKLERIQDAQRPSCMAGELQWRERWNN
ncbi:DUF1194 domain-containing protein [Microvirga flavescens]|uniref:DUF1194 domain-containing protein n=1 Tax=Microvirga flavescens TaxID=2249811 RepID=UPI000DD815C1|nr:DUF1194 domain-containing protein [Microvirga flavescens]